MSLINKRKNNLSSKVGLGISTKPNEKEYNKKYQIYKLSQTDDEFNQDVLEDEFVNKVFNKIGVGTSEVNLFLVPAEEFVDPRTGEQGVLICKDAPLNDLSEPDVDTYLPKFVFKGFKDTYSIQNFAKDKVVYFVMEELPQTDEVGKVLGTRIWLLYNYEKVDSSNKNFIHTKITLSVLDDNVAKNSTDQYIIFNYYLNPIQPKNAAKLLVEPLSLQGLPVRPFEIKSTLIAEPLDWVVENTTNLDNWNLDLWLFELIGSTFKIKSGLAAEYYFYRKLYDETISDNKVDSTGTFVITTADANGSGGIVNKLVGNVLFESGFIPFENYNIIYQDETIVGGHKETSQEIIDLYTDWKVSGKESNITQLPEEFTYSKDTFSLFTDRQEDNWINTSSYLLMDFYDYEQNNILAFSDGSQIYISKAQFNENYTNNTIDKNEFIKKFIEGTATLNGLAFNDNTKYPDVLVDTFLSNIRDLPLDIDGWVIHNSGSGGELKDKIYYLENIKWIFENYKFNKDSGLFSDNIIKLPNPDSSLGSGIEVKKQFFTDNYDGSIIDVNKTSFTISWKDISGEVVIQQLSFQSISGSVKLTWLDKDDNLCVGTNYDGTDVIINSFTVRSPQEISGPLNTRYTITYI